MYWLDRSRVGQPWVRIPVGERAILFCITSRPALGPTQPPTEGEPRVDRTGREVNHSSRSSAEVRNKWSCTSTPTQYLNGVDRENFTFTGNSNNHFHRSKWPSGLRPMSLLGLGVRIPPEARMSVSCECCVLSGGDLCDGPIRRPEESFRLCCVIVCDL
jgi:hypothetical protein